MLHNKCYITSKQGYVVHRFLLSYKFMLYDKKVCYLAHPNLLDAN